MTLTPTARLAHASLQEALDYLATRPAPPAAYRYGEDSVDLKRFLDGTTSGGVASNAQPPASNDAVADPISA